jgi:hypothetical protein
MWSGFIWVSNGTEEHTNQYLGIIKVRNYLTRYVTVSL